MKTPIDEGEEFTAVATLQQVRTKRAFVYARVSTQNQSGEKHVSLETQQERARAYIEGHGWQHAGVFIDVMSGRRDDRQQYRAMVERALNGEAEVIVVQYLDRFGRRPQEILSRIWELNDRKISVEATDEDIKEEMLLLVRAGLAGAESKRISERVRSNMERAAAKGVKVGRPAYGLQRLLTLQDGKPVTAWQFHPEEYQGAREMYRLYVEENRGFRAVADALNAQDYRPRLAPRWTTGSVAVVLKNPALRGAYVYGKKLSQKTKSLANLVTVENAFPAILAPEEWTALQQRLAIRAEHNRGRTHSSSYLLSGIARCGECGGPMIGRFGPRKKSDPSVIYHGYACSRRTRATSGCPMPNNHSARKLERAILEALGKYADPKRVRELLSSDHDRSAKQFERELQRVERELAAVEADFHKNLDLLKRSVLDEAEFNKANLRRREQRTLLENRRADLAQKTDAAKRQLGMAASLPKEVASFLDAFQTLDIRQQKAQLQLILKAAHVFADGRVELEFRP